MLQEFSPGELLAAFKRARELGVSLDQLEEELLRRLNILKCQEYPEVKDSRLIDSEHPFEQALKSPRVKQLLRKDQNLATDLYSHICTHTLFNNRTITPLQADLFLDTYSATPERASFAICRAVGIKNKEYFSKKKITQTESKQAKDLIHKLGWESSSGNPPSLNFLLDIKDVSSD